MTIYENQAQPTDLNPSATFQLDPALTMQTAGDEVSQGNVD